MNHKILSKIFVLGLVLLGSAYPGGRTISLAKGIQLPSDTTNRKIVTRVKNYLQPRRLRDVVANCQKQEAIKRYFSAEGKKALLLWCDFCVVSRFGATIGKTNYETFASKCGHIDFLYECLCPYLSRTCFPEKRSFFEGHVLLSVEKNENIEKRKKNNKPLRITFFGSGELFAEWLLLNKLIEFGFTKFKIRFIDLLYGNFLQDNRSQLLLQFSHRYMDTYHCKDDIWYITRCRKSYEMRNYDQNTLSIDKINDLFVQFLRWFENNHPQVTLDCTLYASLDDYCLDCEKNADNKSDVLIVEDLDDKHIGGKRDLFELLVNGYQKTLVSGGLYGVLISLFDFDYLKNGYAKDFHRYFTSSKQLCWKYETTVLRPEKSMTKGYVGKKLEGFL